MSTESTEYTDVPLVCNGDDFMASQDHHHRHHNRVAHAANAVCQVPGCPADLRAELKPYCMQRHICQRHLTAEVIECPETQQQMRFCLQCARLEPLEAFVGTHRSCQASLLRRPMRYKLHDGVDSCCHSADGDSGVSYNPHNSRRQCRKQSHRASNRSHSNSNSSGQLAGGSTSPVAAPATTTAAAAAAAVGAESLGTVDTYLQCLSDAPPLQQQQQQQQPAADTTTYILDTTRCMDTGTAAGAVLPGSSGGGVDGVDGGGCIGSFNWLLPEDQQQLEEQQLQLEELLQLASGIDGCEGASSMDLDCFSPVMPAVVAAAPPAAASTGAAAAADTGAGAAGAAGATAATAAVSDAPVLLSPSLATPVVVPTPSYVEEAEAAAAAVAAGAATAAAIPACHVAAAPQPGSCSGLVGSSSSCQQRPHPSQQRDPFELVLLGMMYEELAGIAEQEFARSSNRNATLPGVLNNRGGAAAAAAADGDLPRAGGCLFRGSSLPALPTQQTMLVRTSSLGPLDGFFCSRGGAIGGGSSCSDGSGSRDSSMSMSSQQGLQGPFQGLSSCRVTSPQAAQMPVLPFLPTNTPTMMAAAGPASQPAALPAQPARAGRPSWESVLGLARAAAAAADARQQQQQQPESEAAWIAAVQERLATIQCQLSGLEQVAASLRNGGLVPAVAGGFDCISSAMAAACTSRSRA